MKRPNHRRLDLRALRCRVMLVFQEKWRFQGQLGEFAIVPSRLSVADIARELGVSRQSVYRACPELAHRSGAQ